MTIFRQMWYCRESRYLQMSMSMPGWTGSGSMVQKRLEKENWAGWAEPKPGILGLTGSAGNRQQDSFLATLPKTKLGWALMGQKPVAN